MVLLIELVLLCVVGDVDGVMMVVVLKVVLRGRLSGVGVEDVGGSDELISDAIDGVVFEALVSWRSRGFRVVGGVVVGVVVVVVVVVLCMIGLGHVDRGSRRIV